MRNCGCAAHLPSKRMSTSCSFPVAAIPVSDGQWRVELHGWVFEQEPESLWRKAATYGGSELMELLGSDEADAHNPMFAKRFSWFLVDSERRKRIVVRVGDQQVASNPSEPNGHFTFPAIFVGGSAGEWLNYSVESAHPHHKKCVRPVSVGACKRSNGDF